ncbi:MAG: hypothetical protein FJW38_30615 [Acidobacteria bacterium]|nr:hypothetical protein [Acidobacteriota bacterium]
MPQCVRFVARARDDVGPMAVDRREVPFPRCRPAQLARADALDNLALVNGIVVADIVMLDHLALPSKTLYPVWSENPICLNF